MHHAGLIYMAPGVGGVTVVDAATGARVWQQRIVGRFAASPVAGDGKVYFVSETGEPSVRRAGRTPAALFSLLKPKTRIPPHNGVSNARVLVHLPLIVPEGCGFRVGNQLRSWEPGKALIFDDTIEHEAWNDSDKLRVVMIFDIWHPSLSLAEQSMLTAMSAALNAFAGQPAEGYGV